MAFSDTASRCGATRTEYSNLFRIPTSCSFVECEDGTKILFLYNGALYVSTLNDFGLGLGSGDGWQRLCAGNTKPLHSLTRAEKLLRERMRVTGSNLKYDYLADHKKILIHGSTPALISIQDNVITTFPDVEGAIGLQSCPSNPALLAFVSKGDIYLSDAAAGRVHQLTFTKDIPRVSAGSPPFIIQEEFDRYEGFSWQSVDCESGVLKILYEEVNEEGVTTVRTFNPAAEQVDEFLYPRPGEANAKSVLKLLVLDSETGQLSVEEQRLSVPLSELFPECCEYLVRFGWMPEGDSVWVQLLDRRQQHILLAVLHLSCFVSAGKEGSPVSGACYVLWEETSSVWTMVSDCLEFLPTEEKELIRFLWLSESSGYRHLHLVEATHPSATPPSGSAVELVPHAQCTVKQITQGPWNVLGSEVCVDPRTQLVYFHANKASPLDKHLYVIDLSSDGDPKLVTKTGFYHDVTLDTEGFQYFLSVSSNESSRVTLSIHSLAEPEKCLSQWCAPNLPPAYTPPTQFTVKLDTGEELYGVIYSPEHVEEGVKVPAILYTYGGPVVQLVTRGLSKHLPKIQSWRQHGYAVVVLDNRGSANRGLAFEAVVKGHMGHVEVEDQVLAVKAASETVDFIDIKRIAILGWSYGGYLSLMASIKYPEVFKVCVAGAPVTDWMDYDTGYTERYLGIPPGNSDAYTRSSVLPLARYLPSETGRLLLLHGLCDENVFFKHSAKLCDELVSLGKPHVTQFYCQERHGLRSFNAVVHCDATVLQFLKRNL